MANGMLTGGIDADTLSGGVRNGFSRFVNDFGLVILAAVPHNFPTPSETVLQQKRDNQQLMEWRTTGPDCCQAFKFEGGPSCKTYRPGSDRSGVMAFS